MDKLYYYVIQADHMLLQYLTEADELITSGAISDSILNAMSNACGLSPLEDDDNVNMANDDRNINSDSDDDDDEVEEDGSQDDSDDDNFYFFETPPLGGGIVEDK